MRFNKFGVIALAILLILACALVAALVGQNYALAHTAPEVSVSERVETVLVPEPYYYPVVETVIVTETVSIIDFIEVAPIEYYSYMNYYEKMHDFYEAHWKKCEAEYPVATYIWCYLTSQCGLSDEVTAGILGNIMNECGGNSLKLNPTWLAGNGQYYGICMWAIRYNSSIKGKDLEYQLTYLADSMVEAFNRSGALYKKGFDYEAFCALDDPTEAAIAFMKVYERPSSASLSTRQRNALNAYAYFVKAHGPN